MNKTEYNLLLFFKKNPEKEFSTTDILVNIFPEDYKDTEKVFKNQFADKQMLNKAKRKKGQLHRKILYYLNNLVEEDILKISKIHTVLANSRRPLIGIIQTDLQYYRKESDLHGIK